MNRNADPIRWLRDASAEELCEAMNVGVRRALREHKRLGNAIVVWDDENQRVVTVPPEEINVPDEPDDLASAGERGRQSA